MFKPPMHECQNLQARILIFLTNNCCLLKIWAFTALNHYITARCYLYETGSPLSPTHTCLHPHVGTTAFLRRTGLCHSQGTSHTTSPSCTFHAYLSQYPSGKLKVQRQDTFTPNPIFNLNKPPNYPVNLPTQ